MNTTTTSPAAAFRTDRLPLVDRIVLVTGGSRGIGAATVRALHRDGATVVLSYGSNEQRPSRWHLRWGSVSNWSRPTSLTLTAQIAYGMPPSLPSATSTCW